MNFQNKKYALITGATSGIGYEIALILSKRGYNLILASRNEEKMKKLQQEFNNVEVHYFVVDLTQDNSEINLYNQIKEKGYNVEILINNSGFGLIGEFHEYEINDYERLIKLNILSLTKLTYLFSSDMIQRKHGYIMNVASTASFLPIPYFGVYAASKSYVRSFTMSLYYEFKKHNVNIISLNPGTTKTHFIDVADQNKKLKLNNKYMMEADIVAQSGVKAMFEGRKEITPHIFNKISKYIFKMAPLSITNWVVNRYIK